MAIGEGRWRLLTSNDRRKERARASERGAKETARGEGGGDRG